MFSYIQLFNGFVWMNYAANKSEIIQKFCENKDKPELKCEGTCHMKKMMIDEDKGEQDQNLLEIPEILLYTTSLPIVVMNQVRTVHTDYFYRAVYSNGYLDEIDIPPRA